MNGRIIFLLEEPSMRALLEGLLPRLFPGWVDRQHFQCIAHEGKTDLDRSIPRKLSSWRIPGDRFVVVRDCDGKDCRVLKKDLQRLCPPSRPLPLIRIVCQELESWYLADLKALASAYAASTLDSRRNRRRFADPDQLLKPSNQVKTLIPAYQKISGARLLAPHLDLDPGVTSSHSFRAFLVGVRALAADMGYRPASGE